MSRDEHNRKPIIMLNIDSLMPASLEMAMQTGRAPALKFFVENGHYTPNMVTSFPTMSVTIDSSLLTGTYADAHRIAGLNWFDVENETFVNYGTGFRETFRIGVRQSIYNMLHMLNEVHLSDDVETIYEALDKSGCTSASINSFVYRGHLKRTLRVPKLLRALTPFTNEGQWTASTPSFFSLGTFGKLRSKGFPSQVAAGNYKYVARDLAHLIRNDMLPEFTFCVFQDMDLRLHFKGPTDMKMIQKIDRRLQKILNLYNSWDDALKQNVWIIIGDNGHSATGTDHHDVVIDLRKLLKDYQIAHIQHPSLEKDEVAICVNQRMAYVYALRDTLNMDTLVEHLKKDERIDIIAWKEKGGVRVVSGMGTGELYFRSNGAYTDSYGQTWHVEGDLALLNIEQNDDAHLLYGDFPDALARLHGALNSHKGRYIVVNAKPGCEFKAQLTPSHISGAAHGSLHKQESHVPLIIAGTDERPSHARIIDLKSFVVGLANREGE
ncbi:alkaline phosphatase family protein [Lentibacillus saliphilus]|uniref:alkaline phosphatase family protein n=1 Tax=Lentibacillus saliphilus TaxID=2737028 RepID=UPI001C2F8A06|nr:alkaline phosphatase family protein [Lentibacillus saliphilus]